MKKGVVVKALAASALHDQIGQYIEDHYEEIFAMLFGEDADPVAQAAAFALMFDVATFLGHELDDTDQADQQATMIIALGYMMFWTERVAQE